VYRECSIEGQYSSSSIEGNNTIHKNWIVAVNLKMQMIREVIVGVYLIMLNFK